MGRQINFYLHPDDYQEFEDMLTASGDVVLLPYYQSDNILRSIETTLPTDIKKEGDRVYIVRKPDLSKIELQHIEKFGYWLVDDNHLPVLHYDRCNFDGNRIIRGRLYFQPQFVKDMQWINKTEDFVGWADNVIKTARRKLKKYKFDMGGWSFSEYVGKHAKEWLDKKKRIIKPMTQILFPLNQEKSRQHQFAASVAEEITISILFIIEQQFRDEKSLLSDRITNALLFINLATSRAERNSISSPAASRKTLPARLFDIF